MAEIQVERVGEGAYQVDVSDATGSSTHRVTVSHSERERYAPDAEPEELVRESFQFLLERESKEAILSRFGLSTIERYFPEYPEKIRDRLGGGM